MSEKKKHAGGAPSKYTPELLEKAWEYLASWRELEDPVPMLCGLASHCEITKECVSRWRKDERKAEFDQICARVELEQERQLIAKGLTRATDSGLTKLMLMRHGYSDHQKVDLSSSDGSMSPVDPVKSLQDLYEMERESLREAEPES